MRRQKCASGNRCAGRRAERHHVNGTFDASFFIMAWLSAHVLRQQIRASGNFRINGEDVLCVLMLEWNVEACGHDWVPLRL
ncbi:hypothetical protein NDU88_003089 [Pleurodeles waltl]|uniref:Uncharacterized protein n=1 Tax=Pleurodeles waltl TaxID=8319 RepID=A0AAV7M489_PLEWA|nr:hypothetical protein NDU88_003089 [Pleurodeles waltl]